MIVALQTAVAELINAKASGEAPYAQAITAEVAYLPADDLATLENIKVYVVPSSMESELLTRSTEETDCGVDVAVVKKLVAADRDTEAWRIELAGMVGLVEEIAASLRLGDAAGAIWKKSLISPIYDPKRLRETGVFLSVLRLTYWSQQ